jgi:solute carrier family 25 carnitine/acylcarnitine transporter 20/29
MSELAMTDSTSLVVVGGAHSPLRQSVHDIIAGTAGGICTVLVGHPLDTIKVRLQTAGAGQQMTMAQCISFTLKTEGIRGFYKGMQSPLLGEGFFNAAQFFAYGRSKQFLLDLSTDGTNARDGKTDLSVGQYFIAGGMTGFLSTFVESPIDLFKSQLQTQVFRPVPLFTTFPQAVSYVWKTGGVRGCYQGMGSTFLRTTPATAVYFGVYEFAKTLQLAPGQSKDDLSSMSVLTAGGLGGVSYWLSSFPLDSIKSAMQADHVDRAQRRYSSVLDCARKLYAEGGITRFYRGLAPCLIRSFPANAACFFAYEKALQFLDKV